MKGRKKKIKKDRKREREKERKKERQSEKQRQSEKERNKETNKERNKDRVRKEDAFESYRKYVLVSDFMTAANISPQTFVNAVKSTC